MSGPIVTLSGPQTERRIQDRPYEKLAAAVLHRAITDGDRGDASSRRFLMERSARLTLWCRWLDLDPSSVKHTISSRWCVQKPAVAA